MASDDDYDPHLHRLERLAHPTNNIETLFHLIKGALGTGVLAMPEAFKFAGMINGVVLMLVFSIFSIYCIHVLVRGQYILCKKKKTGLLYYSESATVACEVGPESFKKFKNMAPIMVDFFLIFYQTGCCCIYWVFIGSNIKYILDLRTPEKYPLYMYMLMLFFPILAIMCVRNLKLLAPLSMLADVISLVTFSAVFYYIFENLDQKFSDRPAVGRIRDFPLFLGTVLFSLQSIPMCMAVENNMETPGAFRKTFGPLNVGYGTLTALYLFVAMFGYWKYGEDIQSSITMNFPPEETLAAVIVLSYCMAIYVSYGINAYVPINIIYTIYIEPKMDEESRDAKKFRIEIMLRLLFVLVTGFFATTVPLLGLIISLCGSFCLSALGIVFPALTEMCAYWEEGVSTPKTFTFWKDIGMIIIGMAGLLSGLYSSFLSMYEKLSSGEV